MDQNDNNNQSLDSILDSLAADEAMEKKIDEFSKAKQRSKRIARARETSRQFQQTYSSPKPEEQAQDSEPVAQDSALPDSASSSSSSLEATRVQPVYGKSQEPEYAQPDDSIEQTIVQPVRPGYGQNSNNLNNPNMQPGYSSPDAGGDTIVHTRVHQPVSSSDTIVYSNGYQNGYPNSYSSNNYAGYPEEEMDPNNPNQTVIMDENEIQNLLDEDEPLLKREYLHSGEEYVQAKPRKKKKKKSSWKLPVMIIFFGVIALGAFMAVQYASAWIDDQQAEEAEEDNPYYEQLLNWAMGYNTLSDDDKKDITALEKVYNKLSDSQKSQIDEVLSGLTGKNFNELLAAANTKDKPDNTNNNREIAEKKAQIQDQINSYQSQINDLTSQMSQASAAISEAYSNLNEKTGIRDQAQAAYDSAAAQVSTLSASLQSLQNEEAAINAQIAQYQSELETLSDGPEATPDNTEQINTLQSQIETLQTDLQANQESQTSTANDLAAAQSEMASAKTTLDSAQNDYNSAQSAYDKVKDSDSGYQSQIDDLQAKIDSLNSQLYSL